MSKAEKLLLAATTPAIKTILAEDLWSGKNAERVYRRYTSNSQWRNRSEFVQSRKLMVRLLKRNWTQIQGSQQRGPDACTHCLQ